MVTEGLHVDAVRIEAGATVLDGELALPSHPSGVVVLARATEPDGDGADRIAHWFAEVGLGTLQVDLLSPDERADGGTEPAPGDPAAMTARWLGVVDWLTQDDRTTDRPVGLFGVGPAASAALAAAGQRAERVSAVVTAGGRPQEAGDMLRHVAAPTLLIAAEDEPAKDGEEPGSVQALSGLTTLSRRETVPVSVEEDATALEEAASIARDWFAPYLAAPESNFEEPELGEDEIVRRKG